MNFNNNGGVEALASISCSTVIEIYSESNSLIIPNLLVASRYDKHVSKN